jgi:hypothetical protein
MMRKLVWWLCGMVVMAASVACSATAGSTDTETHTPASAKVETPPAGPKGVVWTKVVKATANGNSLQKTSGCDGCPDAGAVSEQQIASGNASVEFTASENNTIRGIGLTSGSPGTHPHEIKFSFLFQPGGVAEIRESGQWRIDTPFVAGDVFKIAVQSGVVPAVVRYYKNGKLLYRSTAAPEYPLVVGASLLTLYSTINNVVLSKTP